MERSKVHTQFFAYYTRLCTKQIVLKKILCLTSNKWKSRAKKKNSLPRKTNRENH